MGGWVKKDGDNFCTFSGKKGFKENSFFQQRIQKFENFL